MKKWLKSPWGISIGTTVFSFLLTIGYDIFKSKPVFNTIWSIFVAIWKVLFAFLTFDLKVWWILLGIAVIVLVLFFVSKISESRTLETNQPDFMKYTNDVISGWNWHWVWEKQYDGKYGVENLHPVCPKCNTPLIREQRYGNIVCPRCNYKPNNEMPETDVVKLMIYDNLKKGLLPQTIDS